MANPSKKKNAFLSIHGHFYQPPRENPWLETIEVEESAHPDHDWNERIALECYRPMAYARVLDGDGKILGITNNYSSMSFNFGPTLLPWLEKKFPSVYRRILEADHESLKRYGHGNALAQVYNHIIMPLANERDKETEVLWGIADFEKRFHRKPEALWLPETAVDHPTLQVLVKHGIRFIILSPFQALRVRTFEGKKWTDVSQGRIDSTRPYRCFIRDASGKKLSNQFIDIFFYNGTLSKEIAFGELLNDGDVFCDQFAHFYQESKARPQLVHIATDGETYGHHKKFGEMALAYAMDIGCPSKGLAMINPGAFLKRFPPVHEVEIDEGPKGEGTSWSCSHGVGRWKEDCGCSTGGKEGWNQKWRTPLREALDLLRDELSLIFEREGERIFRNVWEARNNYIDVILDRSSESTMEFFKQYGSKDLDEPGRIKGIKLLEMQRHALQMYTSCGWFFADLAGLETLLILQHAARAIQLGEELTGQEIEKKFLPVLSKAESNHSMMKSGEQVYELLVKPKSVTPGKVVNHYAVTSLLDGGEKEKKIFSYRVEKIQYEKMEKGNTLLAIGQVRVSSDIIPEPKEFLYGLYFSRNASFRTWVSELDQKLAFNALRIKGIEYLDKSEGEITGLLTSLLGNHIFTLQDTFKEERQMIFQKLLRKEFDEFCKVYAGLFDRTRQVVEALAKEGMEIPYEIRMAAEVTLSQRLFQEAEALKRDFKTAKEKKEIDKILEEAGEYGFQLRKEKTLSVLNEILIEKMKTFQESRGADLSLQSEMADGIMTFLDLVKGWGFDFSMEEAQNVMGEILDECFKGLEEHWWGEGVHRPFPPNSVSLAEKLGFNVEKYLKIIHSSGSEGR